MDYKNCIYFKVKDITLQLDKDVLIILYMIIIVMKVDGL